ncbi:DNA-binding response regulator [Paenibacillus oryzae]|uniref:DNA-binding response regulator n=1 Tax=Paenibacillus oryzae TaxID=1844972 RepID=A0A1A5YKP4_9BACL|nr:response regulator [Paenibacillus oryzae]OBR66187.1 DNA-binding response regulator [Paenibacillus oryzae]
MYRLLVVDDEEIITDGLYEVFHNWMPDKLDVCRAYSGKEALGWMSRTRIDIVLTDIRMPGMSGLELSGQIRSQWPRCRVVFLTGYSEFDYAYQAIQIPNARYLLKTEGYDKVMATVLEVIQEFERDGQMGETLQKLQEQSETLVFLEQWELLRQLIADSSLIQGSGERLADDLRRLDIPLNPDLPVMLTLGRFSTISGKAYGEKRDAFKAVQLIWNSFMGDGISSVGMLDLHGDMVWLLQPLAQEPDKNLSLYLEGMLELIQEACMSSLGLPVAFTFSGFACQWQSITPQYDRLKQLQQLKVGDGISMILKDRTEPSEAYSENGEIAAAVRSGSMEAHLEAGREADFLRELKQLEDAVLSSSGNVELAAQAYYSVALVLLAGMKRMGPQARVGERERLLRLDGHASIKEAFRFLEQTAVELFRFRRMDDRDKTSHVIDRICQYIEDHLGEDVSLVHLAEVHYFNPSYLSRLFKQERGINLSEYIDKCRIRRSKELLKGADLKIREVALLVGYDAAHSFTRFFKKATGLTPQEYRDSLYRL